MGRLKDEFFEVLSDEHSAIPDLEAAHRASWEAWETLHESLPVSRTLEQNRQLDGAYAVLSWAKWKLDQARMWSNRHGR